MSKQSDNVMLVPGESGWEIWSGSSATGFTLLSATGVSRAADVTGLPSGDLIMLFPVRAITALPLKVTSEDPSLLGDMALMHAERQGLRPDPMAGQLTDHFTVSQDGDQASLLSVVLRPPGEGEMPPRGPKEFDLSARSVVYAGDSLVVWKEFDRWVFAVSKGGRLVYCQATAVDAPQPDESFVREVRLALIQLSLQGLDCNPSKVVVYSNTVVEAPALASLFGSAVEARPKPAPVLPEPRSKLLPADVRAARRHAQRRQQIVAGVALVAVLYLAGLGWAGYDYWKSSQKINKLRAEANEVAPEREAYQQHIAKWDELAPVVDINKSPVELMYRVAIAIPQNSNVRLKTADVDGAEIKLTGQAQQTDQIGKFAVNLQKSDQLAGYSWENQQPTQGKTGWDFVFTGRAPGVTGTKP